MTRGEGVWEGWMARGAHYAAAPCACGSEDVSSISSGAGGLEILDPGPPNHLIHWPLYRHAANKEEEVRSNYTRGEK
jgi:hypothetical protein